MSERDMISATSQKGTEKRQENLHCQFEFRSIRPEEAKQGIAVEQACFPPDEACSPQHMRERIAAAADLFLVAAEKSTGQVAGILNGLATDEEQFRDEFFTDISLYRPDGKIIMILGLAVLPGYRRRGLAAELMQEYVRRLKERGKERLILTCLDSRVPMYEKFGFVDDGISESTWGGRQWHAMTYWLLPHQPV